MLPIVVTSSVLILVLAALRYALRGKISLRLQYALWLIAAVRLLAPVSIGSLPVSVLNAVPPAEELGSLYTAPWQEELTGAGGGRVTLYDYRPVRLGPASEDNTVTYVDRYDVTHQVTYQKQIDLSAVLTPIWCAGMAVMAVWFVWVNASFRRRVRKTARRVDAPGCPLPVFVAEGIPSPCLSGLFRPAVYVTPGCLEGDRLKHVLAHELTHRKHLDPLWSLVRCVCLAVHWFNPLVWLAASLSRRDCELACDEGALARLGEAQRTAYGRTLIGLVAVSSSPAHLLQTATTMVDRKRGLKERLLLIAKRPRMLAVTAAAVVLIAAVAAVCTFAGAEEKEAPTPPGPADSPDIAAQARGLLARLRSEEKVLVRAFDPDGVYLLPPDVAREVTAGLEALYQWSEVDYDPPLTEETFGPPGSEGDVALELELTDCSILFYKDSDLVALLGDGVSFWGEASPRDGGAGAAKWLRGQIDEDPATNYRFRTDDRLMYYLLNEADGAYAEGAQHELGERFLARPGDILSTMTRYRGVEAARWPGYEGDASDMLVRMLVSEFQVMRDIGDREKFAQRLNWFSGDAYGGMVRDVWEAWNSAPGPEELCGLPTAAEAAFRQLLSGDAAVLADGDNESAWAESFPREDVVYLLMDVDGDGEVELLLQHESGPETANATLDFRDGLIYVQRADCVDGSELEYPLRDGTMVYEWHFGDRYGFYHFRYTPGYFTEGLERFTYTPAGGWWGETDEPERWQYGEGELEEDDRDVTRQEFERLLEEKITSQRLDASAWKEPGA